MRRTGNIVIRDECKMSDIIDDNPVMILLLDHFGLDPVVHDKSVARLCDEKLISRKVFILFANLYNGYYPTGNETFTADEISTILLFLRQSHRYYKQEKYPEIRNLITQLYDLNTAPEIHMVGKFFDEYFGEVTDHLTYEDTVVYPYFSGIQNAGESKESSTASVFSANEYRNHHTDIESKLADLKNLLLKYIPISNDHLVRRKLLTSLYELEFDLKIHSLIEETVLIPLIDKLEKDSFRG